MGERGILMKNETIVKIGFLVFACGVAGYITSMIALDKEIKKMKEQGEKLHRAVESLKQY